MNRLIILFLFFSTTVFSQNYYPLDKASDTEIPTSPINLVASNVTETTADLSWTASTDNIAVTNYNIYNDGVLLVSSIGNVINYSLTGLTSDTLYNLTVRAIDDAGNESNDSNNEAFTTEAPEDTEAPTTPINLVASNVTETTADLTWTASTDNIEVTNYNIYNNGVLLVNSIGNVINYSLTGLTSDTLYNLTVRAIDDAGNESNDSNNEAFTTEAPEDTEAPTTPINLVASNVTETTADLTWTASTDNIAVTNYNIYNDGVLLVSSIGNVINYSLTGLTSDTLYNLTVRAIDDAGNESNDSNNEIVSTTSYVVVDTQKPTTPINLVISNVTETTADLTWTASTDNIEVTNYNIYNNGVLLVISIGNVTNYTITGLTSDTLYNLTVRAIDDAGNESNDSNNETFTTEAPEDTEAPTTPINLVASNVTETTADLTWTASTDNIAVTNYNIYNDGVLLVSSIGNVINYSLTGLTSDTLYKLTVRAIDDAGNESNDSNNEAFTTEAPEDTEAPTTPINLVASNVTETTADLTWTASTDNIEVTNYNIYNNGVLLVISIGNVTNYTITGLTSDTLYNLTVRAIDDAGNESNDSNNETFTTEAPEDTEAPTTPINLVASNVTATTADLTWTASTDNIAVTNYNIYNDGVLMSTPEITKASFTLTNLNPETTYNITVRALDAANNESNDSNSENFTTQSLTLLLSPNLKDEIAYFSAKLLPITKKDSLQAYIDIYGDTVGVRLEAGEYCTKGNGMSCADSPLIMKSNQKLFGHPNASVATNIPPISIAAGSSNVRIERIQTPGINFEAGSPITNCKLTSIVGSITTTGGQLENNWFIDVRSRLNLDCSASGYLRSNTFLRQQVSAGTDAWVMHGNDVTPSYGCMHIAVNILNPWDNGTNISGIEDLTIIGLDAEAWNWRSLSSNAMLYMRNMGTVKITDLGGAIAGYLPSTSWTPCWDIEAEKLSIFNSAIYNIVENPSIVTGDGDVFVVNQKHNNYNIPTGDDVRVFFDAGDGSDDDGRRVLYNGLEQLTTISTGDAYTALKDAILIPQRTPYDRVVHETLPNPTGANWSIDRIGQPDSHDYIQNLIDTNGIAELPEGIFYIGSPLTVTPDQGIIGQGTGKTALVGLTDDFPLVEVYNLESASGIFKATFSNMTLQGGESGIKFIRNGINDNNTMTVFSTLDFLIFRNQTSGLHLYQIFGMDNHFMNQVSYVDCDYGFHQDPKLPWAQEFSTMTYVDKVLFYKNQYINCGVVGAQMDATRANNLDTFYGCNFDNNAIAINISSTNYGQIINSDFTNNKGEYVMGGGASLYNCEFSGNNTTKGILNSNAMYIEGCNFYDDLMLFGTAEHWIQSGTVRNSLVTGELGSRLNRGVIMNSTLLSNPDYNKLLMTIKPNGNEWTNPFRYVIIDETPNPYPQFLVEY